jgi:hypothetical protein
MASSGTEKRYLFSAHASAFGGHIRRPNDFFLPTAASTNLPIIGGSDTAEIRGYEHEGVAKFDYAATSVVGDYVDRKRAVEYTRGNHGDNNLAVESHLKATVQGLSITNRVPNGVGKTIRIGTLALRMDLYDERKGKPPAIRPVEATFENVEIDGHVLQVNSVHTMFSERDTYDKLASAFQDAAFYREFGSCFRGPVKTSGFFKSKRELPEQNGIVAATIVKSLEWRGAPHERAVLDRNRVYLPDFGSLYFGEVFLTRTKRRITMVRVQLGSPDGGDAAAIDGGMEGNGWPP